MSLIELVDNSRTDKQTAHSYLPVYEELLQKKKQSAKSVLEIGIYYGGSIKLWKDYFTNAKVYAVELFDLRHVWDVLHHDERIVLYTSTDAYNPQFVKTKLADQGLRFDMILDDGPHTLESMKACIQLYLPLLADDGILIIEDIQSMDWLDELRNEVSPDLRNYIKTYDLRTVKNRHDDILFVIDKS
jgi:cephalosporin hydroxylase